MVILIGYIFLIRQNLDSIPTGKFGGIFVVVMSKNICSKIKFDNRRYTIILPD